MRASVSLPNSSASTGALMPNTPSKQAKVVARTIVFMDFSFSSQPFLGEEIPKITEDRVVVDTRKFALNVEGASPDTLCARNMAKRADTFIDTTSSDVGCHLSNLLQISEFLVGLILFFFT